MVIPLLQDIDFTGFLHGTGSEVMIVPFMSARLEFKMRTGMFFSTAGRTVAGCNTFAPK